jgi:hypothetical protein
MFVWLKNLTNWLFPSAPEEKEPAKKPAATKKPAVKKTTTKKAPNKGAKRGRPKTKKE